MTTTRSPGGDRRRPELREVGLTLPGRVKAALLEAAAAAGRSAGEWVLVAAADHGAALQEALGQVELRRRPRVDDATFAAVALTAEERDELDERAVSCGLNRSVFVTSVSRLALGEELDVVVAPLAEPR